MNCNVCCKEKIYCKDKCKKCYMREYGKKYYIENIVREKVRLKSYKVKNKEAEKERNSKWREKNRDYINNRERNKYKNNPQIRIANTLRRRLGKAIKSNQSHIKNLGCSVEELKKHLEGQFQKDMSWDNYGVKGWHIDHIIPLSSFDLTDVEELKKACHYTNLQPLWAKDNISKSNKKYKKVIGQHQEDS